MMANAPGRPRFPDFREAYDGSKMREFVRDLEAFIARLRMDGPLIVGGGAVIEKYFSASATWNPANVVNGAQVTTTVTVTGVALADANPVMVGFSKDLQGMRLTGYVSSANTVTVVLRNDTGGALNLDAGTLRVGVWRH